MGFGDGHYYYYAYCAVCDGAGDHMRVVEDRTVCAGGPVVVVFVVIVAVVLVVAAV